MTATGRDRLTGILLVAPTILLLATLIFYPLLEALVISLHRTSTLTMQSRFVGLENFEDLWADPAFWRALGTTLTWTAGTLLLQVLLGVGFALMLHGSLIGRTLARGLVLFPYLLPTAVAVLVWRWLFNDLYGFLNHLLLTLGLIRQPVAWLSAMPDAMVAVIVVGAWKFFPFVVISVLARLQSIPLPLYEAARIDGATRWAQFWDITLPQLSGVLAIVVLLRAIWDFKEFDLIYLLTGGGPGSATETLPLLVYRAAFQTLDFGQAAAVSVAMLAVMLLFFAAYATARRRIEA